MTAKPKQKLKLASIKADLKRQREGDWVDYPAWPGVRFNVSAFSSPAYQIAARKLAEKLAKLHGTEAIPPDELHAENGALLAEHILHGWEGIDVDYSADVAMTMLTDPAYEALNNAVRVCAVKLEEIKAEFIKDAVKN